MTNLLAGVNLLSDCYNELRKKAEHKNESRCKKLCSGGLDLSQVDDVTTKTTIVAGEDSILITRDLI